jgi:hypothetical protein
MRTIYTHDLILCAGSVYYYTQLGSKWSRQSKLLARDGAMDDYFGGGVGMYQTDALIGALGDDDKGDNSGSNCIQYHRLV